MAYQPEYTITHELLKQIVLAESAKELIDHSPLVPYWERSFQNNALARQVHHSTAIEGNRLDFEVAEKIIAGEEVNTSRVRDVKEIVNYRNVVGYISVYAKKEITISYLYSLHKILGHGLLSEKYLGRFRDQQAVIVNSQTGDLIFDAAEPEEILEEIEELLEWDRSIAGKIHPILRAGILHFELVKIHPFFDFNGRTARIVATWSLYRDGFDINKFFSLEEYYDQDIEKYYRALNTGHSGDLTAWLTYFGRGVAEELQRVKEKVLELSRDYRLRAKLGQVGLNERQVEIINYLIEHNKLANPDFSKLMFTVSDDTILRDLRDLQTKGVISKKGKTRGAYYILN